MGVVILQLSTEREGITFELQDVSNGPNSEPLLEELIHQASYRDNTLGLPNICPEENIGKISRQELLEFMASNFDPCRMVLTGVNVDHSQFVELAKSLFVGAGTSWEDVASRPVDMSVSQFTASDVKARIDVLVLY